MLINLLQAILFSNCNLILFFIQNTHYMLYYMLYMRVEM